MAETTLFKELFNAQTVATLAEKLHVAATADDVRFDRSLFISQACEELEPLEFMNRVRQISGAIDAALSGSTAARMAVIAGSLVGDEAGREGTAEGGAGVIYWPYGAFIGAAGLDDWDASFGAMVELTKRLTSEFAVRPFLASDVREAMRRLEALVNDEDHHVRRFVSEGTRTRLPWAKNVAALAEVQEWRIRLLRRLRDDDELYVRRSVANHLQDVIKDDVERGVGVLTEWMRDAKAAGESGDDARAATITWVARHASRGLLKAGEPRVLALFGFEPGGFDVVAFEPDEAALRLGETLQFGATVRNVSGAPRAVRADWVLRRPTPTGRVSTKVFRWKNAELGVGDELVLRQSFKLVERSTRKLAPGLHFATLRLNGEDVAEFEFEVRR